MDAECVCGNPGHTSSPAMIPSFRDGRYDGTTATPQSALQRRALMTKSPSAAIAVVSSLVPAGLAVLGAAQTVEARITQVVIETTESPAYGGKAFGTVGQIVLESGWDVGAPPNGKSFTATVPIATNPDGSSIIGSSTDEFV